MKKATLIAILLLAGTGCSMEASLENLNNALQVQNSSKTTGLVSGSTQTGTTTGGGTTYRVQSTLGNYMSGIEQSTADSKYKVYSSVQGAIVSTSN